MSDARMDKAEAAVGLRSDPIRDRIFARGLAWALTNANPLTNAMTYAQASGKMKSVLAGLNPREKLLIAMVSEEIQALHPVEPRGTAS